MQQWSRGRVPLIVLALVGASLVVGLPARAAHEDVVVDGFVLSICGQQGIAFSGTAIGHAGQFLVVKLDGVPLSGTLNGIDWSTGFVTVGVGNHVITAEIISGQTTIRSAQFVFSVVACPPPAPLPSSGGGGGGGNGGGGGGGGGNEEPQPQPVKKGTVKGVATTAKVGTIPNHLIPAVVERVFREVFGRKIRPAESTYWKKRARIDQRTQSVLKGAMLTQKTAGRTMPPAKVTGKTVTGKVAGAQSTNLVSTLNAIFHSVYRRNPSPSEHRYWLSRTKDKPTEQALRDAMRYHKSAGIRR